MISLKKILNRISEGISMFHFGHPIEWDGKRWVYIDNKDTIDRISKRECPKCHKLPTKDGHDPCSPNLPGVSNACCGHGKQGAYIQFDIEMETIPDFGIDFTIEDNTATNPNPRAKTIRFKNTEDYLKWTSKYIGK